jgi:hypothetical protein
VWWRPVRGTGYERFTEADDSALTRAFEQHARTALLTPP